MGLRKLNSTLLGDGSPTVCNRWVQAEQVSPELRRYSQSSGHWKWLGFPKKGTRVEVVVQGVAAEI